MKDKERKCDRRDYPQGSNREKYAYLTTQMKRIEQCKDSYCSDDTYQ